MNNDANNSLQYTYSDGEIENDILDIVRSNCDYLQVLANDNRWPILYHFSPERRNLLEWYPFKENSSLLEIGAGCGALTGLFCEKLQKVTALELSERRAKILATRYQNINTLKVITGNFHDTLFTESFDYITLIGVLEYTKSFIRTEHPYRTLLGKIYSLLKSEGKLIIAIENKFGLKYWAGAREDHTGQLFDSIEGYFKGKQTIETFGKQEIQTLLHANGFENIQFYYPHPDYKLPTEIFSDHLLPSIDTVLVDAPCYDQDRYKLFSERLAFFNLIKNQQFDFFANSFLIFCDKG